MAKKKSVASASQKKLKKARAVMDQSVVKNYVSALLKSLGDDTAFQAVFVELSSDKSVRQVEAVGIGSEFVAPMAASTSRATALERILKRHKSLMSFKSKQRAVGGRSAA